MKKGTKILDYMILILCVFGFSMVCMGIFTIILGNLASESPLFALADKGIPIPIMFEFLLLSIIIGCLRYLFFTHKIIQELSVTTRIIGMVVSVFICSSLFIFIFNWFPVHVWQSWLSYFTSFSICSTVGITVAIVKNNLENKRLEEGLDRIKQQWREENEK